MHALKVKQAIIGVLVASSLITGCSNPTAANEENFKKAISEALPKQNFTCFPLVQITGFMSPEPMEFPYTVNKGQEPDFLKALVKVGMLSAKPVTTEASNFFGKYKVEATEYSLTEDGNKSYKRGFTQDNPLESLNGFCLGEAEVDKVVNFTEPQNNSGVTITHVKYTIRTKNIPKWAKDSDLRKSMPVVALIVLAKDHPLERTMTLTLTSKGWTEEL